MRRSCSFGEKVPDLLLAHTGHRGLLHCVPTITKLGPDDRAESRRRGCPQRPSCRAWCVLTVVCQVVTFPRRGFSKCGRPPPRHERGNAWCLHNGKADVARFGGTTISKVLANPALAKDCKPV